MVSKLFSVVLLCCVALPAFGETYKASTEPVDVPISRPMGKRGAKEGSISTIGRSLGSA